MSDDHNWAELERYMTVMRVSTAVMLLFIGVVIGMTLGKFIWG